MLSLDATQLAIVAATVKDDVSWLFQIDRTGNDVIDDYLSTKTKTWDGHNYTFKIAEFDDIEMNRAQSESGIQAPSNFDFTISNKDNSLTPSDFSGGNVTLILVIKAGANEAEIRTWNFDIEGVEPGYQQLFFHCRDWLQKYLGGDYPKTPLISRLFPEDDTEKENFCVPLIFGKPCIPIVPLVFTRVTNGYMEVDANWANWGSTPPTVNERSNEHVKEGSYSRKFTVQGAIARSGIKSDNFTTENGKTYTLDFWFYSMTRSSIDIGIRKGDDSGWIVLDKMFGGTGFNNQVWCHCRYSFTEGAATGGAGAYIVFYDWAAPELARTTYIDQVFLGKSFYLLGAKITNPTDYDVDELQTPRDWDADHQIWSKDAFTFNYSHKTGADGNDYTFGEFIIVDADNDGTPDDNILFKKSKRYLPAAAWYTRSDTISKTNPGDILDYILKDWGIPAARIDATTLASVKSTYTGWGLTWNVGFWTQEPRKKILARLLLMCHTELIVRDKIYFKVHSKTSQKTLDKSHILKTGDRGEGSFKYDLNVSSEIKDSAYVAYQEENKCLDQLLKILITAKGSSDAISSDIVRADYVQDSQDAQRIGTLAIQRKFLALAKESHISKGTCLALECDDMISLNHADYGGTYDILIDSIKINKNISINIEATKFSQALDDWGDLSPSAIQIIQIPDSGSYKVIISGPDAVDAWGNYIGNVLPGRLRIGQTGNYILFDPVEPIQTFVEGGVTRMKIGDLGTDDWGIEFLDHAGNSIFKLDGSGNNTLAGWDATDKKLTCQSGQVGMNAEETGGTDWRFWAGHATPGSAPFRVDENGNLHCTLIYATGGTIGGWTIGATKISITGIELDQANNRIRAYTGANYVDMTAGGLTGYDSVLGTVFRIFTDGSAPEFSSGIIKECVYEIYTSGVIRTNANPSANGGLIINNTDLKGYTSAGLKVLQLVYGGTDQGDVYFGDYDNTNPGLKYDHSAGVLNYIGNIKLLAGGDIEMTPSDTNPSVIKWSNVHNMGAGNTTTRGLCFWPTTENQEYFQIGYDAVAGAYKRYQYIDICSYYRTYVQSRYNVSNLGDLKTEAGVSGGKATIRGIAGGTGVYVSADGVLGYIKVLGDIKPVTTAQKDIGSSALRWDVVYAKSIDVDAAPSPPTANRLFKESIIKGWVQFNGIAITIQDSFNVTSITDNGVGDYTITWDRNFANDDYAVSGFVRRSTTVAHNQWWGAIANASGNPAVGSVRVAVIVDGAGGTGDPELFSVIAIGDQ